MALGEDALDELNKASAVGDGHRFERVITDGKAIILPNCTKVTVLDTNVLSTKVRIGEGQHENATGWVPFEFVK